MSGVRVLVGTHKGAFVLTLGRHSGSTGRSSGPHFAGWEIYHVKGSPADPDRLYASQSSGWFGQVIQRSDDGGATWEPVGNEFSYDGDARAPTSGTTARRTRGSSPASGTSSRRSTTPTRSTPGSRTPALFRSTDGGQHWQELPGLRTPPLRAVLAAGRGRDVPAHDHPRPGRRRAGCSPRSRPRARSGPTTPAQTWRPVNRGLHSEGIPDPDAEVGHCVHRHRDAPVPPGRAVHAEALGRDAQRRRGRVLARGQRQPADRLRLPDRRARARAGHRLRGPDHQRLRSTSRPRASCASTAAGPAATSGSR